MIKQCKKCGSENLYLEPRIKGQDVMTANMVALKCKDCGSWLKWCPKDERKYYYANKQSKDKWQKLKEWLEKAILRNKDNIISKNDYENVLVIMQELEGEDVKD